MAQDAREIILRSAALDQRDVDIARNYACTRRTEQRRLDASGRVKSVESKTHEVLVLYGQPYERLIAKDDKPLPPDQERKEQRKLDQELEHRSKASEKDREKRAREEAKSIEDQKAMIREVADAYSFRLLGEERSPAMTPGLSRANRSPVTARVRIAPSCSPTSVASSGSRRRIIAGPGWRRR